MGTLLFGAGLLAAVANVVVQCRLVGRHWGRGGGPELRGTRPLAGPCSQVLPRPPRLGGGGRDHRASGRHRNRHGRPEHVRLFLAARIRAGGGAGNHVPSGVRDESDREPFRRVVGIGGGPPKVISLIRATQASQVIPGMLAAFEKPTTYNFIFFLVTLAVISTVGFFYVAFRKPAIVPGKLQLVAELGFQFVRENIVLQMIGQEGMVFFTFLSSLFFFILFGNIWEVIPGVNATMNARIAFPLVLATISWLTYNTVGIRRHGFLGYMRKVMFPPGVPIVLKPLIALINFVSEIIFRPITLTVRLFANMVAGHFLLAVFFLGTLALFSTANFLIIFGLISSVMAVAFVAFEIFVSILQAFIFAVLSASYISEAMEAAH